MTLYLLVYVSCLCLPLHPDKQFPLSQSCAVPGSQDKSEILGGKETLQVDPKAPLSNKDLVILLINRCNDKSEENRKNTEDERVHTDNQVRAVITGFGKQLSNVIEDVNRNISDQTEKIADLELKLETVVSYCEQLLYTHRRDVYNAMSAENCCNFPKTLPINKNIGEHVPQLF
jgi:hypothetical protein